MNVKIGELADGSQQLMLLATYNMPVAVALRLKRVIKAARTELDTYGEQQKELALKHGAVIKQADNGSEYFDFGNNEKRKAYQDALKPCRDVIVEIPGEPLSNTDLDKIGNITPGILKDLEWLIAVE